VRDALRLSLALGALALGCTSVTPAIDVGPRLDAGPAIDAADALDAPDDPDPVVSTEERAALETLGWSRLVMPPDPTNAFADDPRAAHLGHTLFFDTGLSGPLLDGDDDGSPTTLGVRGEPGRVSCAGCHVPADGFVDTRTLGGQISLAASWVLRRTPTLLDVAHRRLMMWDGRRDSLFSQAVGPIESWNEMNSSRLFVAEQIASRYRSEYESIFGALPPLEDTVRFPVLSPSETGCELRPGGTRVCRGVPGDGADFDGMSASDRDAVTRVVVNVGKAIGAYERLLSCGASRFDDWLAGDASALDRAEIRGAVLFVGRAGCIACHAGPLLTDQSFHDVGLAPATVAVVFIDLDDRGAALGIEQLLASPLRSTSVFSDGDDGRLAALPDPARREGAFLTPPLRCLAAHPSFMHTGQLRSLTEVIDFFDRGGHPAGYLGTNELRPLGLSTRERADLVAFLRALEGPGPAAALRVPPT